MLGLSPGFRRYLAGYALQVAGWTLGVVTAPFLALRAGEGWLAAAVVVGLAPRLAAPLVGRWLGRAPAAWLALASLGAAGACALGAWGAGPDGPLALGLYLVLGTANAWEGVVGPVVAGGEAEPARMRANAALAGVGLGLPALLGPLAGWLAGRVGLGAALGLAAALFALRALSLVGWAPPHFERRRAAAPAGALRALAPYALALLAAVVALGYLQVRLPPWFEARGLGAVALGAYNGALSGGMLLGAALAGGPWARRPGRAGLAGFAALALGLAGLSLPAPAGVIAAAGVLGLGLALVQTLGLTELQARLGAAELAGVSAAMTAATALAMAAGALLGGGLGGVGRPGLLWGLAAVAAASAWAWRRKRGQ